MNKKIILILILICLFSSFAYSAISNLKINPYVRLNEVLTISGDSDTAQQLCKFIIKDSNGYVIERLSDEYTFADNSFYAQRQIVEPPYYRGDDFNVVVTCGTSSDFNTFNVLQPLGLAHPIQKTWEFYFDEQNQFPLMLLGSFIGLIVIALLIFAFIVKKGGQFAR